MKATMMKVAINGWGGREDQSDDKAMNDGRGTNNEQKTKDNQENNKRELRSNISDDARRQRRCEKATTMREGNDKRRQ